MLQELCVCVSDLDVVVLGVNAGALVVVLSLRTLPSMESKRTNDGWKERSMPCLTMVVVMVMMTITVEEGRDERRTNAACEKSRSTNGSRPTDSCEKTRCCRLVVVVVLLLLLLPCVRAVRHADHKDLLLPVTSLKDDWISGQPPRHGQPKQSTIQDQEQRRQQLRRRLCAVFTSSTTLRGPTLSPSKH